jgi:hypothetical protein
VQGRLREEPLSVIVDTACAQSGRPMRFEIDSELHCRVIQGNEPLVFLPDVNWATFSEPNIIHAY